MLRGRPLHACSIQGGACPRACARPHCALHLRHQAAVALTVTSFCALNMSRDAEQTALSRHSRCASHGPAVWKRAGGLFACVRVAVFRALQVGSASPAAVAARISAGCPTAELQISPLNTSGVPSPSAWVSLPESGCEALGKCRSSARCHAAARSPGGSANAPTPAPVRRGQPNTKTRRVSRSKTDWPVQRKGWPASVGLSLRARLRFHAGCFPVGGE